MHEARRSHMQTVIGVSGLLVAGGAFGFNVTSVELLHKPNNGDWDWALLPPTNQPHADGAMTAVQRKVYAIHGETGFWDENGNPIMAGCEVLDLDDLQAGWQRIPDCPVPRVNAAVVVYDDDSKIAYIGGKEYGEDFWWRYVRRIDVYDVLTEEWSETELPDMPIALHVHFAALVGHNIIVGGGWCVNGPSRVVHVLDTTTRQWKRVADLPSPCYGPLANVVHSRYLVVAKHDAVLVYDAANNSWAQFLALGTGRRSTRVSMLGSNLLVTGGSADRTTLGSVRSMEVTFLADVVFERIRELSLTENLGRMYELFPDDDDDDDDGDDDDRATEPARKRPRVQGS